MTAGAIRPRLDPQRIPSVKVALPFEKSVWLTAALVSLGYFIGVKIGFALTFQPHSISTLWPPSSILLAALVVDETTLLVAASDGCVSGAFGGPAPGWRPVYPNRRLVRQQLQSGLDRCRSYLSAGWMPAAI